MVSFHDDPEEYNDSKMLGHLDGQIKRSIELAQKVRTVDQEIASSNLYLQKVPLYFVPFCELTSCSRQLPLKGMDGGKWKIMRWVAVCLLVSNVARVALEVSVPFLLFKIQPATTLPLTHKPKNRQEGEGQGNAPGELRRSQSSTEISLFSFRFGKAIVQTQSFCKQKRNKQRLTCFA